MKLKNNAVYKINLGMPCCITEVCFYHFVSHDRYCLRIGLAPYNSVCIDALFCRVFKIIKGDLA